jgi:transcriptional regulator with XRE-family HTH domain
LIFGQRFKQLRIEKGLKQQELADDFNKIYGHTFAKSSISQYEHGKRRPETEALKNFALYFNVSIDYLLGLSEDREISSPDKKPDLQTEVMTYVDNFFGDDSIDRDKKDEVLKKILQIYTSTL